MYACREKEQLKRHILLKAFREGVFKGNIWGKKIIIIKRQRLSVYVQTWPRRERQHLEDEVGEINKMN